MNSLSRPFNSCWRILIPALPYIALITAICAAYANIYGNEFLYDDISLIVHNQHLRSWHDLPALFTTTLNAGSNTAGSYYRPVQSLLYMVMFQEFGLSTTAFHLLNLLLHAANTCLVYRLGRKLNFHPAAVIFASLLWALHPIHTEAVTYMSATADVLYAFFCLSGALVLLPDFTPRRIVVSCGCLVLALLSKENAIAFPPLAASLIYLIRPDRLNPHAYLRLWPLAAIVMIYALMHFLFLSDAAAPLTVGSSYHHSLPSLIPFATLPIYLKFLVWPTTLYMEHDIEMSWIGTAAGLAVTIAAGIVIVRPQTPKTLPLSWGLVWFFSAHLPVFYVDNIVYEHWMYLPSVGLILGFSEAIARSIGKQALAFGGTGVIGLLGFMTYQQNKWWHDPVIFYTHIINQGLPAPKAHVNLGAYYTSQGAYDKAMAEYKLAIEQSGDQSAEAQNNLAVTLLSMPDSAHHYDEALAHLRRALEIDPTYYHSLNVLAHFYTERGDNAQAEIYRQRAEAVRKPFKTIPDEKDNP